jgi:hypothetical protein
MNVVSISGIYNVYGVNLFSSRKSYHGGHSCSASFNWDKPSGCFGILLCSRMFMLNQQFSEAVQVVSAAERPSLGQLCKRMADKGETLLRRVVYRAYPRGSSTLVLVVNDQAVSRAPLGFILSINEKKRHLKWQQKAILVRPNKR